MYTCIYVRMHIYRHAYIYIYVCVCIHTLHTYITNIPLNTNMAPPAGCWRLSGSVAGKLTTNIINVASMLTLSPPQRQAQKSVFFIWPISVWVCKS